MALPLIKTIQSTNKTQWQTPASILRTARGVEKKYFAPSKGYEYVVSHPHPCSLVVSAVNQKECQGQQALALKSKEAKRMDLF